MNASWRFAGCANAIKGDLVRRGALAAAHICEKSPFSQSTVVSPTRLADRASNRGSITLDVVLVFNTAKFMAAHYGRQSENAGYDTDHHDFCFWTCSGSCNMFV